MILLVSFCDLFTFHSALTSLHATTNCSAFRVSSTSIHAPKHLSFTYTQSHTIQPPLRTKPEHTFERSQLVRSLSLSCSPTQVQAPVERQPAAHTAQRRSLNALHILLCTKKGGGFTMQYIFLNFFHLLAKMATLKWR